MLSRNPDFAQTKTSTQPHSLLKPSQFVVMATNFVATEIDSSIIQSIRKAQEQCPSTNTILQTLRKPTTPNSTTSSYSLDPHHNILLFNSFIYIPNNQNLKLAILERFHDSPTAGHFGFDKTFDLITRNFYCPKMCKFVDHYIRTCDSCARNKTIRHKPFGMLRSLPPPNRPWDSISMDFIVKLPLSQVPILKTEFDSIWVVVDRLIKFAYFIPCNESMSSEELAFLFLGHIFATHGLPLEIISDRGSLFVSKFISTLCKHTNIRQAISTAFHPQTDGQTEQINEFLEQYLRIFINYEQSNWVPLLPLAQFAYNNSTQTSTKLSPYFANFGFHPHLEISLSTNLASTSPLASEKFEHLRKLHSELKLEILHAQEAQQRNYNIRRQQPPVFEIGQKVWLIRKHIRSERLSSKLDHKKLGPFEIVRNINNIAYELRLPKSMKIHPVFHISLLEPISKLPPLRKFDPPPPPVIIDDQQEWEVQFILDSKRIRNKLYYKVHWKGFDIGERSWEPAQNLQHCPLLIQEFHSKTPRAIS